MPSIYGTPSIVDQGSNSSTWSHSYTMPNSSGDTSRRFQFQISPKFNTSLTSATYGGKTLTQAYASTPRRWVYELLEDDIATLTEGNNYDLVVNFSSGQKGKTAFVAIKDCQQDTPTEATNSTNGTSISTNITVTDSDELVVDFVFFLSHVIDISADGSQTENYNYDGGHAPTIGSSYKTASSNTSMEWSNEGSNIDYYHFVRSFTSSIGTLEPTGIASGESFGTSGFTGNIQGLTGIASGESFGTPQQVISIIHNIIGISSGEAFGSPTMQSQPFLTGITSAEAFGTATLKGLISPDGIASGESFGTLTLVDVIVCTGITSAESFGLSTLGSLGSIIATGITSGETFGDLQMKGFIDDITGISTGESFGTPLFTGILTPTGIASGEAFGTTVILITSVVTGITSAEAFGTPMLIPVISPVGIVSAESFGSISFPVWIQRIPNSGTFVLRTTTTGTFVLRTTTSGTFVER